MATYSGPNILKGGLITAFDSANDKSFKGEPTTNSFGSNFRDLTGTGYSPDGEWTSDPTRLSKTYVSTLQTPIGLGATLIQESGNTGFHHLSRYGGGSESGLHSLSCFLFPISNDITEFAIGLLSDGGNMIFFNLNTRQITYGGGIVNRNAIIENVPGWPGWLRVGANFEGRSGGWVGCFGYSPHTSYTGTVGAKKCYVTGVQYESQNYPTQFTSSSRGSTVAGGGGFFDLSKTNNNGEIFNGLTYLNNSLGTVVFDGTDDYIKITNGMNSLVGTSKVTFSAWIFRLSAPNYWAGIIANKVNGTNGMSLLVNPSSKIFWQYNSTSGVYAIDGGATLSNNVWYNIVGVYDEVGLKTYLNGSLNDSANDSGKSIGSSGNMDIIVGAHQPLGSYFHGRISTVKIYNRSLSSTEILQNFNAIKGRFGL
jgi:hypothetical protein